MSTNNGPDFFANDKLKVIRNTDDDGEPCEGRLILGEIVTMIDPSSRYRRAHITIQRANGRCYQLEKDRFELVK